MKKNKPSASPRFQRKILAAVISSSIFAIHTSNAAPVLEEVIVTSTKEMQNLQDVPQAITAFTTDDIKKQGFVGIDEYSKKIPALAFARREPGGTSVVFRGVTTSALSYGTNPSSSVYLDEQPITSAGLNPNPRMIDIERLEALSGPQGTLFGDSSQSGALRIITNKADPSGFSAWVEGTVGTVERGEEEGGVSAMINIPVNDRLAVRLVGFNYEEAGYIDNVLQKRPTGIFHPNPNGDDIPDNSAFVEDDINSGSEQGARLALHWDVNDDWLLDAMVIYQKTDIDGFGDVNLDVGELEQVRYNDEYSEDEWYQVGLTLEGDLGFATAVISASYFDREFSYQADTTDYLVDFQNISDQYQSDFNNAYPAYAADFMFYDLGHIDNYSPDDFSAVPGEITSNLDSSEDRYNLEARLQFEGDDGDWNAIVGVFYNKTESDSLYMLGGKGYTDSKASYYLNNLLCADPAFDSDGNKIYDNGAYLCDQHSLNGKSSGSWGDSPNWLFGVYTAEIEDTAIFTEGNFDVTEDFTVTAGGRWYENERTRTLLQGGFVPEGKKPSYERDYINNVSDISVKEDGFVGKFGVRYHFDYDKMVYATYSEGFRSGGGNAVKPRSIISDSFDSDFLINNEIGFKSSWMDNRLRFNIVGYKMIWEDIQLQVNDPQPNVFSFGIINFAEAEIIGFETEVVFAATDALEINLTYADIEAELSKDDTVSTTINGEEIPIASVEEGTRLPVSPDKKASVGLEYKFQNQWFGLDPYARYDYSYVGDSVNSINGLGASTIETDTVEQESYQTMDFKMGLENEEWSFVFQVENIENKIAQQYFNPRWGSQYRVSINKPRNYSLTVRRSF